MIVLMDLLFLVGMMQGRFFSVVCFDKVWLFVLEWLFSKFLTKMLRMRELVLLKKVMVENLRRLVGIVLPNC